MAQKPWDAVGLRRQSLPERNKNFHRGNHGLSAPPLVVMQSSIQQAKRPLLFGSDSETTAWRIALLEERGVRWERRAPREGGVGLVSV